MLLTRLFLSAFLLLLFIVGVGGGLVKAQESHPLEAINDTLVTDDLGEVTDQFQELFFKGLAQSGIENYERAINYLKKSLDLAPDPSVIHFQLAKNYEKMEDYEEAVLHYKEALKKRPDEDSILINLLELYQLQGNIEEALKIAAKLAIKEPAYYMDLAHLETLKGQDIKALDHLNLLEQKKGETAETMALRQRLYRKTQIPGELIIYFQEEFQKNPSIPQNLRALVQLNYLHHHPEEAYRFALQLKKLAPEETEVALGGYPHYLDTEEKEKAVQAMKQLIQDERLNKNIKMKVIRDFTHFVKDNPSYEADLIAILGDALNEGQQSNKELAEYYKTRDTHKALQYLEKATQENPQDYKLVKETLQLQMEEEHYQKVLTLSDRGLQYFPTQAFLYLIKGKALNNLNQFKKAEESLLDGLNFVIEDEALLGQFYEALIETYTQLNQKDQLQHYTKQLGNLKI